MRLLGWAWIQFDGCSYKKKGRHTKRHQEHVCTEKRPQEDTPTRETAASQGERLQRNRPCLYRGLRLPVPRTVRKSMAIVTRPKLTNTSGHHGSPMAQSDGQCLVLLQFDLSATLAPLVTLLLGCISRAQHSYDSFIRCSFSASFAAPSCPELSGLSAWCSAEPLRWTSSRFPHTVHPSALI